MVIKNLVRLIITTGEVVVKAFSRAVREEMKAGQQAAAAHGEKRGATAEQTKASAHSNIKHGISLQEAVQILDAREPLKAEDVQKKYEHLFNVNAKKNGGSFYLQSKVFRAKERIDAELGISTTEPSSNPIQPSANEQKQSTDSREESSSSSSEKR